MLLILVTVIGFGVIANAQDIILKKDASEIKAKVLEITDQQVKYKEFDFQDGPTRNINISDVFMITYENGQKEVFNKLNVTTSSSSKRQNATNCAKNTAFGLDMGFGGTIETIYNYKIPGSYFASALGIRAMRHFNPYFGIDFFKINWITDVLASDNEWLMRLQIMSGIRGNSPAFLKCMSVYSAFRLGYGMTFVPNQYGTRLASHFKGLCLETELGLNLTPTVFAGFAYNYHKYFGLDAERALHTLSFRLGFNLGKTQEAKTAKTLKAQEIPETQKTSNFVWETPGVQERSKEEIEKARIEAELEKAKEERAKIEAEAKITEAERKEEERKEQQLRLEHEQKLAEAKKELPNNLLRWIDLRYPKNKYFYTEILYLEEPDFKNEEKVYRIKLQRKRNEIDNATVWFTWNGKFLKVEDTSRTEEEVEEDARNALRSDYYYKVGKKKK